MELNILKDVIVPIIIAVVLRCFFGACEPRKAAPRDLKAHYKIAGGRLWQLLARGGNAAKLGPRKVECRPSLGQLESQPNHLVV
jgi:hypothetical protein